MTPNLEQMLEQLEKVAKGVSEGPWETVLVRGAWRVRTQEPEIVALMNCLDNATANAAYVAFANPAFARELVRMVREEMGEGKVEYRADFLYETSWGKGSLQTKENAEKEVKFYMDGSRIAPKAWRLVEIHTTESVIESHPAEEK